MILISSLSFPRIDLIKITYVETNRHSLHWGNTWPANMTSTNEQAIGGIKVENIPLVYAWPSDCLNNKCIHVNLYYFTLEEHSNHNSSVFGLCSLHSLCFHKTWKTLKGKLCQSTTCFLVNLSSWEWKGIYFINKLFNPLLGLYGFRILLSNSQRILLGKPKSIMCKLCGEYYIKRSFKASLFVWQFIIYYG